ncbi:MAG: nucleotidyltransferase domain-containing protein [Thermococcus sp.]|nr:nucleotidyltransferase domain-containing protein [Thermococcus sp.]
MHELVSTPERIKVLRYVLERHRVGVEETARATGLSKGLVSKTLRLLVEYGMAEKSGRSFRILNVPKTRELKRFINFLFLSKKLEPLKEEWTLALGIYGSFATGENTPESDLDVWVFVKRLSIAKSASLKKKIEKATEREANLLVLTPERLRKLRDEDPVFYYSLAYGSMVIWGEGLERLQAVSRTKPAEKGASFCGERVVEH